MFKKIGIGLLVIALIAVASYKLFFDKSPVGNLLKGLNLFILS